MATFPMDDLSLAQLHSWYFSNPSHEEEQHGHPVDIPLLDGAPSPSLPMDIDSLKLQQVPVLPRAGPDYPLNYGAAEAFMTDEIFPFDEEWWTTALNQPPDVQLFDGSPQNAPAQRSTIDTALLTSPVETFSPFSFSPSAAVEIPRNVSQGDPSSLATPSLVSPSSFHFSFSPGSVSERASPHSPLNFRRSSLGSPIDIVNDDILEQGYPGDSPLALQRRDILRRTILNEAGQLGPTLARDIKRLANKYTGSVPNDAQPSSGKKPGTLVLHCAWAGCNHLSSRPDRLKTHVFTHLGFKPFPCDRSCGDPHCTAKFFSKGDCNSHQIRHAKKITCEICGEESTSKNLTRHTRSAKCKTNGRRNTSYSI